ncbi:hypothetical protein GCK72_015386 [Caenorhabditis remanei]|uniref:Uncharacterized protein n=1 Tax=Caenorhabditis remanei TaxID=31234 RepID=A0A6A5GWC8_CAERE|nr:hypothetical protein GCK72_015386 [Caenorhabditis remanei]KAF1758926.1 hypothetical protein GCK72_015386 [Caenorhabditis remanei]
MIPYLPEILGLPAVPARPRPLHMEFDASILNSFRIEVTDSLHKGHDIIRSFPRTYKSFIYVDTENSYTTLPHGTDLALLRFCDIATVL